MKDLQARVLTAIVFVAVLLSAVFSGPIGFMIAFLVVAIFSSWEYYNGVRQSKKGILRVAGSMALIILIYSTGLAYFFGVFSTDVLRWLWKGGLLFAFSWPLMEMYANSRKPWRESGWLLLGIFYLGLPLFCVSGLVTLSGNYNPYIVAFVLGLIWFNDTFAYFTGRAFGKHKLFPRISPKKTWEGYFGGVIATLILGYYLPWDWTSMTQIEGAFVSFLAAALATPGDLLESMWKRHLGIKDSGAILPGHGGFLDRFDAFFFVLPFVYLFLL